jgi:hypothetical protein
VAESCTICSSHARRRVRKLLDTPSYKIRLRTSHTRTHTQVDLTVNIDTSCQNRLSTAEALRGKAIRRFHILAKGFCLRPATNLQTDVTNVRYLTLSAGSETYVLILTSLHGSISTRSGDESVCVISIRNNRTNSWIFMKHRMKVTTSQATRIHCLIS